MLDHLLDHPHQSMVGGLRHLLDHARPLLDRGWSGGLATQIAALIFLNLYGECWAAVILSDD